MIMNECQHNALINLKKLIKQASYIDLLIRVEGETKHVQADFLKDLILAIPLYDAPKTR